MYPSTDPADAQREFATDVLRNLLRRIDAQNRKGRDPFLVSHAWTEGPMMYLVYTAPPSDITWGLARDTRESIINPGPWLSQDDPALYYYLCDLEEARMSASFRHPGDPDTILWHGFPREGLPERPSDIPGMHRYLPSTRASSVEDAGDGDRIVINEPRLYGNPL
jgi:hypothetical protein